VFTPLQDISFALRQLTRNRVYAGSAVLSLAMGIGATAAVYSVLYGVLIGSLPLSQRRSDRFHHGREQARPRRRHSADAL